MTRTPPDRLARAIDRAFEIFDRPIRIALGAALVAYCAAVILSRWVKHKLRRPSREVE